MELGVKQAELLRWLFLPPALAGAVVSATPTGSLGNVFLPLSCPGCVLPQGSEGTPSPGTVCPVPGWTASPRPWASGVQQDELCRRSQSLAELVSACGSGTVALLLVAADSKG